MEFVSIFSLANALAIEMESPSTNDRVIDFIQACNEKFLLREIRGIQDGLRYLMKTYLHLVLGKKNVVYEGYG
jgi:hypothetical protein